MKHIKLFNQGFLNDTNYMLIQSNFDKQIENGNIKITSK